MRILKAQVLASKQYISIIRLFEHCGIPIGADFNLPRAKKQLQAEFGMAQDGFIEVNGYTYTRNDVFEEIETPDFFPRRLSYHMQIWESPQILALLEKNTANLYTIEDEFKPFWQNNDFDVFFSPYFAGPFNYLSRTFLGSGRLRDMGLLLGYEDFIQPAEREEAFRSIRIFLDDNIKLLRNVNKENYKIIRPKIVHWIEDSWYAFFNHLPPEFYDVKMDIVTALVNIGVAVQKTHRRDCRLVSEQLISLQDMPESLRNIIVSNHSVYTGSSSGSVSWRGGFWAIWVVVLIIRAASSDSCNSSKSSYDSPYFDFSKFKVSDSISIVKDSGLRSIIDSLRKKQTKKRQKTDSTNLPFKPIR